MIEQSEQQEPAGLGPTSPSSGFDPRQQGAQWAPADFYRRRGGQLDPGTQREVGWGELFLRNLDENFSIPRAFGSLRRGIFGEEFQEDYEPLADPNIGLVPSEFRSMLSDAPNPDALRRRALQLSRELENAKAFELAGGTALFTAGMSAAVLDPLTWVDVLVTKGRITVSRATQLTKLATRLGNARRAQQAAKLGRMASYREGFMVGGATGAITEWDLMSSFELRTEIDSMTQLLGSTVLSAGLGGAFYRLETRAARQAGRDLLAADNYAAQEAQLMPKLEKMVRERNLDPDADQEEIARIWTDELLAGRAQDDVLRLARWKMPSESANAITRNFRRVRNFGVGLLGPAMRSTLSEVDAARAYAHNFSSLPVERRFAPDSVMGRVALEVEKTRVQNDIRVITYAYEKTVRQLAGVHGREVEDYHRIVSESLRRGDTVNAEILQKFTPSKGGDLSADEISEINRIAKEVRSGFEQIEEIANSVGAFQNLIPSDNALGGTAVSYFSRMYKIDAIEADEDAFEALINAWFRSETKENPVKLEVVMDRIKGTSGASHHAKLSSTDQTLARKLLIPDDYEITYQGRVVRFTDFMENNPTTVLESFTNHVVPELLHARRFMSSDVTGMTRSIGEQLNKLESLMLQLKNDPKAPNSLSLKENILAGLYEAKVRAIQLRRLNALETNDAAREKIDEFLELWEEEYEAGSRLARFHYTGNAQRREETTGIPGGLLANVKERGRDEPPERTDALYKTRLPETPDPTNELEIASQLGEVESFIDKTKADLDLALEKMDADIEAIEKDLNQEMSQRLEYIVNDRYGKEETWAEERVGPGTTRRLSLEEKKKAKEDQEALEAAEEARAEQEAALTEEIRETREVLRNSSNNAKRTKEKAEARLKAAKEAQKAPELSPEERSKAEAKVKELKKEVSAAQKEYRAREKELDDFNSEPNPSKKPVFALSREDRKKLRDLIKKRDSAKKKKESVEKKQEEWSKKFEKKIKKAQERDLKNYEKAAERAWETSEKYIGSVKASRENYKDYPEVIGNEKDHEFTRSSMIRKKKEYIENWKKLYPYDDNISKEIMPKGPNGRPIVVEGPKLASWRTGKIPEFPEVPDEVLKDFVYTNAEIELMGGEDMLNKRSTPKNAFTEEPLAEVPEVAEELTQSTLFSGGDSGPYRGLMDPDKRQGFSVTTAQPGYGYNIRLITHDPETGQSIPHMWVVVPHGRVSRSVGFKRIAYDESTTTPAFPSRDAADAAARRTLRERIRDKERGTVPDDDLAADIREALEEAKADRSRFVDEEQAKLRSLEQNAKSLRAKLKEAKKNKEQSIEAYEEATVKRNVETAEKEGVKTTQQKISIDEVFDDWKAIGEKIKKFDKDYKAITGEDPPERIDPLRSPIAADADVDDIASYFNNSVMVISVSRRDAYTRAIEVDRFKKAIHRWYKEKRAGETDTKVIKRLRVSRDKAIADIEQMHRAFMGMPDPQSDPTGMVSRISNVFKTSNILSKMGGVTISSLPDLTLGILVHGLGPYLEQMRYQLANMQEMMPRFKDASPKFRDEMSDRLFAMEMVAEQTRMERMSGFEEQIDSSVTPFERALQKGRTKFGALSGARWWNSRARIFNTMMAQRRLIRDVQDYAAGTLSERRMRDLQVNRVTKSDLVRWKKELDANAKTQDMDGLSNPWEWANAGAWEQGNRIRWEQALLQYSKQTLIDVEDGDLHRFMRSPVGSTLLQFKSFFTSATQRLLVRDLQRPDIIRYARYSFLAVAGAYTHVLKEWLAGRDAFEEEPQQFVLNAIDRSGMLGWAMELNNMLEVATSGKLGMSAALGVSTMKRYSTRNLVDALFGPSLGTSYSLGEIFKEPFTDSPLTDTDVARVRRLVPFNNLFYLRWLFDFGEEAANSAFDVERLGRERFGSGVRR